MKFMKGFLSLSLKSAISNIKKVKEKGEKRKAYTGSSEFNSYLS